MLTIIILSVLSTVFICCSFGGSSSSSPSSNPSSSQGGSEESSLGSDSYQDSEQNSSNPSVNGGGNPEPSAPKYELIKPINDNGSLKRLVKTKYKTESAVVADAVATGYGADSTGKKDSTSAIQTALNYVKNIGGGTVFLPAGKYLVTSTIVIPDYVSLVGDWNKPNADNTDDDFDYGTVILAEPQTLGNLSPQQNPLFSVSANAGIVGITFYYPEQDAENIKNYGYTVYADAPVTATLKNLTFINSAYGIGVSLNSIQNELVNIENVFGTFLYNAIRHNATTDFGFYDNVNLSPKYWQNASSEFKCSNATVLNSFISENLTAIILGDLDDQLISNVTVDGGKIGIKFTVGIRTETGFWGLIHNAQIDCEQGVYADRLHATSGVVFTDSNVGRIENNSLVGCIKMSNSTYQSKGSGKVIQEVGESIKSKAISPLSLEFPLSQRFFVAKDLTSGGNEDNSSKLQEVLNSVGEEGGIVLVPNGVYRLNSTVIIPKNVELRSSQSVFSRTSASQDGKNGVVFISYVSGATFNLKENAGVVGTRIWHAKNDFITAYNSLNNCSYTSDSSIKADKAGAYAFNNESVGAYVGYDFSACDNHVLKSNYGLSYLTFIKAGGKNGIINQCLTNPNFMSRSNLYEYFDSSVSNIDAWQRIRNSGESNEDFAVLRDDIGRTYTKMVRLENAENQVALNVFAYGHAGLFEMVNTTATLVNTSLDYIVPSKYLYELSGGSCDIVGSFRVHGTSIKVNSGTLTAYGRIAFGEVKEKTYNSAISLEDKIDYVSQNARRKTLFNCDSSHQGFNETINYSSQYKIEGIGSWKWQTTSIQAILEGKFESIDVSEYKNGYLHFYIYCSDVSKMGDAGQIEITSSGTCDINEYNWNVMRYVTQTG